MYKLKKYSLLLLLSYAYVLLFDYTIDDIQNYMNGFSLYYNNSVSFKLATLGWQSIVFVLSLIFANAEDMIFFLRLLIVFCSISIVFNKSKSILAVLIVLFSTLFAEHVIGGLRQGVGMIFFLFGFFNDTKKKKIFSYLIGSIIHPLVIWWVITDIVSLIFKNLKLSKFIGYTSFLLIVTFLFFILFAPGGLSETFGYQDRYNIGLVDRSYLGLSIWIFIALTVLLNPKNDKINIFLSISLIQFCSLYLIFESSYRFIQSLIPILIIYFITTLKKRDSKLGLLAFVFFTFYHYFTKYFI